MDFINGITVLNEVPITKNSPVWCAVSLTLLIAFLITLIMFYLFMWIDIYTYRDTEGAATIFAVLACVLLVGTIATTIIWSCTEVPTGEYQYQVTIDEDASFVEFYENYDLIKQDGKIFTIKMKN